jgi:hypothetical protein
VSPAYLSQKLTRPLVTKDGGTLCTVLDARTYMLALPKRRETAAQWQRLNCCWRKLSSRAGVVARAWRPTHGGAHSNSTARLLRLHPDRISAPTRPVVRRKAGRDLSSAPCDSRRR